MFLSRVVVQGRGGFIEEGGGVIILILILILARVTLRVRTTNRVGEDSYCRGGIVSTRFGR